MQEKRQSIPLFVNLELTQRNDVTHNSSISEQVGEGF